IAPEHQRRIFDEHYQVGNPCRQRGNGLGLGLAIVRRIAALHDVSVSLRSTPGRGSRFTLRFRGAAFRPLAPAVSPSMSPAVAATVSPAVLPTVSPTALPPGSACETGNPAPAQRPRLLLVEDDPLLADAFGQ